MLKPKELDCVELKDGRKGCLLIEFDDGNFLMEPHGKPDIEDQVVILRKDIKKIIYVAGE